MIYSMTAFASQQNEYENGQITIELKSVNNRFLDIYFRIPDELRSIENTLREKLGQRLNRGKLDVRITFNKNKTLEDIRLDEKLVQTLKQQFDQACRIFPEVDAPSLQSLLELSRSHQTTKTDESTELLQKYCLKTLDEALDAFITMRANEGQRLAQTMLTYVDNIYHILEQIRSRIPVIQAEYQQKLTNKLRDALETVAPNGFEYIKAEELNARIATESSLFSLRIDVAEELDRLDSHQKELSKLLSTQGDLSQESKTKNRQSLGKRLDFLFQEMNREINTLGSKSTAMDITQAVIELKLLVEQLREQAQNIE